MSEEDNEEDVQFNLDDILAEEVIDEIKIEVKKAQGQKCERCWKILEKKCKRESCPIK